MECPVFGHSAAQCLKKPLPQRTEWVVKGSQIVEQATDEGAAGQSAGVVLPSKGNSPKGSVGVIGDFRPGKALPPKGNSANAVSPVQTGTSSTSPTSGLRETVVVGGFIVPHQPVEKLSTNVHLSPPVGSMSLPVIHSNSFSALDL